MKRPYHAILRELRIKCGYKQPEVVKMLRDMGIPTEQSQVSRWETGRSNPSIDQFIGLCGIYGVENVYRVFVRDDKTRMDYLLNQEGNMKLAEFRRILVSSRLFTPDVNEQSNLIVIKRRTLPIYDISASAGTGQFLDSDSYEMVEVPDYVPETATFGLHVAGDSMEPTLEDGQQIWVHMQPTLENGDMGIFYLDGNAFVKEYSVTNEGVFLISHNNDYEPIFITEDNEVRIYGKVIYPQS